MEKRNSRSKHYPLPIQPQRIYQYETKVSDICEGVVPNCNFPYMGSIKYHSLYIYIYIIIDKVIFALQHVGELFHFKMCV